MGGGVLPIAALAPPANHQQRTEREQSPSPGLARPSNPVAVILAPCVLLVLPARRRGVIFCDHGTG